MAAFRKGVTFAVAMLGTRMIACSNSGASGCTSDADCKGNRVCNAGACVEHGAGSSGTSGSSGLDSSDSSTSSGDPTSCAAAGGTRLAEGFCMKSCTFDEYKPGQDLYGDCAALKMVCSSSAPYVCLPTSWKTSPCTSDADCSGGGKCVTQGTTTKSKFCEPSCIADTNCGPRRCLTSCKNGYYSPLRFCRDDTGWSRSAAEPAICGS